MLLPGGAPESPGHVPWLALGRVTARLRFA
jgi:hypothetical protein